MAVLQRKEAEARSCRVLYDMQAPAEPLVQFDSFINGEPLQNADLVAWVTIGALHTPTAEDMPVTTTSSTGVKFLVRPLNYFDESPATDLTRSFYTTGVPHPDSTPVQVNNLYSAPLAAAGAAAGGAGAGACFPPLKPPFDYVNTAAAA